MVKPYDAIIIGGGLMGTATLYELAKRGKNCVLLEAASGLGEGASFANGGMITPSMPDPWNGPGVAQHLMASFFDPHSPIKLRPSAIPGLMRWGLEFLWHSSPKRHRHATVSNYILAAHSALKTQEIADFVRQDVDVKHTGSLKIFDNEASFTAQKNNAALLKDLGMQYEILSVDDILTLEPELENAKDNIFKGIRYTQDLAGDAYLFTKSIAAKATGLGAEIFYHSPVEQITKSADGLFHIQSVAQEYSAKSVVVCAGTASPEIMRAFDIYLPIKPAKGYSVTLNMTGWNARPNIPVIDDAMHAAITPLGDKLRVVGTAEFTGFNSHIDPVRIDNLFNLFKRLYPHLEKNIDREEALKWTGFRPMSANGVPYIGPTKIPGLWVNTGHGHLGWTKAMGSADILTSMMFDEQPAIDPTPYSPMR